MGLSTGEIVGIVIGVVLAVIFLFFIYFWIKRMIAYRRVVPVAPSTEAEATTIYKEALKERDDYVLPDGTRIDFAAIGRKKRLEENFKEEQRVRDDAELTRILNEDPSRPSRDRDATTGTGFDQSALNQLGLLNALDERGQGDLPAIPEEVEPEDLTGFQTSSKRRSRFSPKRLLRGTRKKTNTIEQMDLESPKRRNRFSPTRVFRRKQRK